MKEPDFTHVQLQREIRNWNDEVVCGSSMVIESPFPVPADAFDKPQKELFDWIITEFPGWIPMAYMRMEHTKGE